MRRGNKYIITDKLITRITAWVAGSIGFILSIWGVITLWDIYKNEFTNDAQVQEYINPVISRAGGFITEVRFDENQPVKKGDTLILIDDREYVIQQAQTEASLMNARAQLEAWKIKVATLTKVSRVMHSKIKAAKATLWKEELELERYKKLVKEESATLQQLEAIEAAYNIAIAELQSAQDNYLASLSDIANAQAQMAVVRAEVKRLEALLERHKLDVSYTIITAPYDGVMGRRTIEKGQMIEVGEVLAYIVNRETDKWVVANYKETQIATMKIGDTAEFTVDAYPDKVFKGVIISLSPATGSSFSLLPPDNSTGNYVKIVQRVPVRIRVVGTREDLNLLRAGMNANVFIAKNQKSNA
ncbi:MAG TPA: HlyD family secretion protein [Cytophagaceae bacterium]